MKKITLTILAIFLLGSLVSHAQVKSNLIKTSLSAPLFRTYVLAYERVLNPDMGLQLGFYYLDWKVSGTGLGGFAITPEFRYYLSETREAPNGAFIAPFLRYHSYNGESADLDPMDPDYAKASITIFGGGLLVGAQRVFKDVISLSAFIGPSYSTANIDYEDNVNDVDLDFGTFNGGFSVRAGINIGVAF